MRFHARVSFRVAERGRGPLLTLRGHGMRMPHYLLKYTKKGKRPNDAPEMVRIEAMCPFGARDKAEDAAAARGGANAFLQLFNEIGLVATRSPDGRWTI
jgi:hypothetical protein